MRVNQDFFSEHLLTMCILNFVHNPGLGMVRYVGCDKLFLYMRYIFIDRAFADSGAYNKVQICKM